MSALVCVPCGKFFRVKKVGVYFEEGMQYTEAGLGDDGRSKVTWGPYKLWASDLCECPSCGAQVLAGSGAGAIAEHYERTYSQTRERLQPLLRVDDCGGKRP